MYVPNMKRSYRHFLGIIESNDYIFDVSIEVRPGSKAHQALPLRFITNNNYI